MDGGTGGGRGRGCGGERTRDGRKMMRMNKTTVCRQKHERVDSREYLRRIFNVDYILLLLLRVRLILCVLLRRPDFVDFHTPTPPPPAPPSLLHPRLENSSLLSFRPRRRDNITSCPISPRLARPRVHPARERRRRWESDSHARVKGQSQRRRRLQVTATWRFRLNLPSITAALCLLPRVRDLFALFAGSPVPANPARLPHEDPFPILWALPSWPLALFGISLTGHQRCKSSPLLAVPPDVSRRHHPNIDFLQLTCFGARGSPSGASFGPEHVLPMTSGREPAEVGNAVPSSL